MSLIKEAAAFARRKHQGQQDDEGNDYFLAHVAVVAAILSHVTSEPEIIAAAYLHDTLEDTDTTLVELTERFGLATANLVHQVTHEGNKAKGYYFPRLKSREAIMIKLADRLSNVSRMGTWDQKRQDHYLRKTKFWRSEPVKGVNNES